MPPAAFGWISGASGLGSVWLYMANSAFTVPLGPVRALMVAALVATAGAALIMSGSYALMIAGAILIGFAYATTTPAGDLNRPRPSLPRPAIAATSGSTDAWPRSGDQAMRSFGSG